ncbi:NADP-dependent malic enzyme 3 [Hibiscus syriacus]|uniref:NADP-dependent malic enzyme 3 n=1 Tax=Hibiscus syriacus TaxID=106335 RepID=A0A6A2XFQ7_HIBSY|nr:NADP-dependent malic enzyme 3 [Hibiscus syriacus]
MMNSDNLVDNKSGGGVEDCATATVDQPVTVTVASGYTLMRDPRHNKGLVFNEKVRAAHYLLGLLPPAVLGQELQQKRLMHILRQYKVPLQRYMAMMDLQERNERLFYKLLIDNVEELLLVIYTPTVGEACQKYGSIFRCPQGLYISLKDKGKILEVLKAGETCPSHRRHRRRENFGARRSRLSSNRTSLGGVRTSACLPVTIDVGTNNEKLLNGKFYIGLRQQRATGQEDAVLLHEFMSAVKQNYGEKVLIQFEDFANHNAFELLGRFYILSLTIGSCSSVPERANSSRDVEAGKKCPSFLMGLIVESRKQSLQHFKKPWAHWHEPVTKFVDAVKAIEPMVLIGTSGVGKQFTKKVVEAMAAINEKPLIMALSNPTSQAECTEEEAYTWSEGRAIFASGSPLTPLNTGAKVFVPGQANNAYIFPGFGLGLIISGAIRVQEDVLLAASKALASQVTEEHLGKGLIYPPFSNIRKISAKIAPKVAAKAYEGWHLTFLRLKIWLNTLTAARTILSTHPASEFRF